MADETPSETASNRPSFRQSRRMVVQLLGSALAMGTISGSVAGSRDASPTDCTDDGSEDARKDVLDWRGLTLTDDEFHLELLQYAPTLDGEKTRLFAVRGLETTVKDDMVTDMDVDAIDMHEDFERTVLALVNSLADGTLPHGFDAAPNVVLAPLRQLDTQHFEHLRTAMETDGVAETFERALQGGENSAGYAGGFVLILVLFILLVIIGAGFGTEFDFHDRFP